MKSWTVVLLIPARLCWERRRDYGVDTHVAIVRGESGVKEALAKAQHEAYLTDWQDWGEEKMEELQIEPSDYELSVMFEGIHLPAAFG